MILIFFGNIDRVKYPNLWIILLVFIKIDNIFKLTSRRSFEQSRSKLYPKYNPNLLRWREVKWR